MAESPYRRNAVQARAEADSATLANARDRSLRAEAAWLAMAERQERIESGRAEREKRSSDANGSSLSD